MDSTILIIIAIILLVLVGAVLLMRRLSWGSSPGYIQVPPRAMPPSAMPSLGPDADRDVRVLLASGQKIQAIKLVRELTGIGLKEAKDYVESLPPASLELDVGSANVEASSASPATQEIEAGVRALLAAGNKIAAIKRVRELTGMSLKAAKDYVESLPSIPLDTARRAAGEAHVDSGGAHLADLSADPEVRALLAAGNKIAAIKRVRELTGMGLKAAKDFVDSL
jgi:ribosomal protein L7/L12